jgi:pyridoxamine 5'-phosphate oxidase family protein
VIRSPIRGGDTVSDFTEAELGYLAGQSLGRLATVGETGEPHVVPVGFRHNAEMDTIDIGGHGIARSKKYRDVARDGRVAFVVDDLASIDPWRVRGIEVRGTAAVLPVGGEEVGPGFDPEVIRITPHRIVSWGIEDADFVRSRGRTVR